MTGREGAVEALRRLGARDVSHLYRGGQLIAPGFHDKLRFPARFYQAGEGWAAEVPDIGARVGGRDLAEVRLRARELVTRRMRERPDLVKAPPAELPPSEGWEWVAQYRFGEGWTGDEAR